MKTSTKCKELMKYAQYYSKYNSIANFNEIPIIEKNIVLKNYKEFICDINKSNEVNDFTSGSTGVPLNIKWYRDDFTKSVLLTWKERLKYNITPLDKFCTFHSYIYDSKKNIITPKMFMDKSNVCLSFSKLALSFENISLYYKKMVEFQPKWLFITPSILEYLLLFLEENNLSLPTSIKMLELTGELLTNKKKNWFYEKTKLPIINHYGSREFNSIAYECPCGKLHILEQNVYVEIINADENGIGYICVSTMMNKKMPLIRYNIKDKGRISSSLCPYDNKVKANIEIFESSSNDKIYINGKMYDYSFFAYLINLINKKYNNIIKEFQIVFENDNLNFNLLIKGYENNDIYNDIKELLNYDKVNFNIVNNIDTFISNGKIKYVINRDKQC